ncbi:class I SAM-dependent methyltransferase [Nafulsella turpanensis]|uniref:class I SAM-dependent methyltransferase n=1 Tax=Nafulsella turpanensis TaxID=1265690 RepID=UPI000345C11E|nr:class I SAM-dependent methyltransferase [Nafulsella turpanensis]
MAFFKTEVTSDEIQSDNPIHQRLLKPYIYVKDKIGGTVVEIGCGDGRGIELLAPLSERYIALDKNTAVIEKKKEAHENLEVVEATIPPIRQLEDNTADVLISFQVIEHILDDTLFLEEIYRILKPGGKAYFTTPNIKMTLSRNPWHIREYTADELTRLSAAIFDEVEMLGVAGNERVMAYHEENRRSVEKITRFDILNLQHRLPSSLLKIPYEVLNRLNRNRLMSSNNQLVDSLSHEDYLISRNADSSLDLLLVAKKK